MKAIKINKFIFSIVFKSLFNKGNRKHFFRVSIQGESKKTDTFDIQMNNKGVSFF